MAADEHNVKIKIDVNAQPAVGAFSRVVGSLKAVRKAVSNVMNAFGVFGMAINGINALADGFKWLKEKLHETERAIARMRFDSAMRDAANETSRLVSFHERLSRLMKDELDTLAKQRSISDIEEQGRKDAADGRRAADRARRIYEAKTPEEEQALRDMFAAEDERLAREEAKSARKRRIAGLDEEDSIYTSKANRLRSNNAGIDAQIAAEEFNLVRANGNKEREEPIKARLEALRKRKEANEAEIAQFEKEAKFRRDLIAALEAQSDYEGPTAGEYERMTAARKRAREKADGEFERDQRKARESQENAAEFVDAYERQKAAESQSRANSLGSFADRIDAADAVSQNRLTAMGLGAGVSARGDVSGDVRKIVDLLKQEVEATKNNKPADSSGSAVYGA